MLRPLKTDYTKILLLINIKTSSFVLNINARKFHKNQIFNFNRYSFSGIINNKVLYSLGRM